MDVIESKEHNQAALDAEFAALKEMRLKRIPPFIRADDCSWPDVAVAVGMRLAHWLPAFSWEFHPGSYEVTGGDLLAIARLHGRLSGKQLGNGAILAGFKWDPLANGHYDAFGEGAHQRGALRQVVRGNADEVSLSRADIEGDPENGNFLFFAEGIGARNDKTDTPRTWRRLAKTA